MAKSLLAALSAFQEWKTEATAVSAAHRDRLDAIALAIDGPTDKSTEIRDETTTLQQLPTGREGIVALLARLEGCTSRRAVLEAAVRPALKGQLLVAAPSPCSADGEGHTSPQRSSSPSMETKPHVSQDLRTLLRGVVSGDVLVLRPGAYCCAPQITASGVTLVSSSHHAAMVGLRSQADGAREPSIIRCCTSTTSRTDASVSPAVTVSATARSVTVHGCVVTTNTLDGAPSVTSCNAISMHVPMPLPRLHARLSEKSEEYLFQDCCVVAMNGVALHVQLVVPPTPQHSALEECAQAADNDDRDITTDATPRVVILRRCTLRSAKGPVIRLRTCTTATTGSSHMSDAQPPDKTCTPASEALGEKDDRLTTHSHPHRSQVALRVVLEGCELYLDGGASSVIVVEGDVHAVEIVFTNHCRVVVDESDSHEVARSHGLHAVLLRPSAIAASRLLSAAQSCHNNASDEGRPHRAVVRFESDQTSTLIRGVAISVVGVELPRGEHSGGEARQPMPKATTRRSSTTLWKGIVTSFPLMPPTLIVFPWWSTLCESGRWSADLGLEQGLDDYVHFVNMQRMDCRYSFGDVAYIEHFTICCGVLQIRRCS